MHIKKLFIITVLLSFLFPNQVILANNMEKIYHSDKDRQEIIIPINENYFIINGVKETIDVPAYLSVNNTTMIPLRALLELYDISDIIWDSQEQSVLVKVSQREVLFIVNSSYYKVNRNIEIEFIKNGNSELKDGVFYIPLRDFGRILGLYISWDAENSCAVINSVNN